VTDRQTDGHVTVAKTALCYASRGWSSVSLPTALSDCVRRGREGFKSHHTKFTDQRRTETENNAHFNTSSIAIGCSTTQHEFAVSEHANFFPHRSVNNMLHDVATAEQRRSSCNCEERCTLCLFICVCVCVCVEWKDRLSAYLIVRYRTNTVTEDQTFNV